MINIRNAFVNSARASIADKRVFAQLEKNRPLWSLKSKEQELADLGYSGDALYNKLIDDAIDTKVLKLETKHTACFVAGTVVHTDKGLVPIQDIKVGDMVLSRDEHNPNGELAYKKVLNTFASTEKKKIFSVAFETVRNDINSEVLNKVKSGEIVANEKERNGLSYLFCTGNHAFWTKEAGWTQAEDLAVTKRYKNEDRDYTLVCKDGSPTYGASLFTSKEPLYRTSLEDVALHKVENLDDYGVANYVDFSQEKPKILKNCRIWTEAEDEGFLSDSQSFIDLDIETDHGFSTQNEDQFHFEWITNLYNEDEENYYVDNVYNIEVEDYHTYFVGEYGIWVHNTNGCFSEDELLSNLNKDGFMKSPTLKGFNGERLPVKSKEDILNNESPTRACHQLA